jgi:hypothetical protein
MTAILFLCSVQCRRWRAAASGHPSGSWAQIWLRHDSCTILPSEPVGLSHIKFPTLQQCREWSEFNPEGRILNSCNSFRSCPACGSPCVFVIVNWCATCLEPGMPLKHLHTTQTLVPEGLFVEKLIVVMLVKFIVNRLRSGRYVTWFTKARVRPDSGPVHPTHKQVGSIRFISTFFYLRSHLKRTFFLYFPNKIPCVYLASACVLYVLPTSSPWFR